MKKYLLLLVSVLCLSGCWTQYGITKGEQDGEYIILETKSTPFSSKSIITEWKYEIDDEGQPRLVRQYVLSR